MLGSATDNLVHSQQAWDKRIQELGGSFLQSWEWGAMQQTYGRPVERVATADGLGQVIVYPLLSKLGLNYLFLPYGPVGAFKDTQQLIELGKTHNAVFLRYESTQPLLGGKQVASIHPTHTNVIDLVDPEKLMAQFKPKWRYNIRLAEKKGVTVRVSQSEQDDQIVYDLLHSTAKQQGIAIHSQLYYATMMKVLGRAGMMQYYIAEFEGKAIAANIVIRFGKTTTYLHGGTDHAYRQVMAPHLLQWQAMQDAYASGCTTYDFFGVAPTNYETEQPNHPFAGITRFKHGFMGRDVEIGHTFELPLKPMWYTAYTIIKNRKNG